ncbi:hypothetical protein Pfo_001966 [Paulownia fortunei]|nr:hypothetical protein Pfo_001966 [Paulownia fortunei]
MYPIQQYAYRPGIYNLVVLLIGGISIAMPIVLSVTMGNTLFVFAKDVDADTIILMDARASQLKIKDAIDAVIVGMLETSRRAGIQEMHFLPFNPTNKCTTLVYKDDECKKHQVSKRAPEQEVSEGRNKSPGSPWKFIGLMPLFDPPRHNAEAIKMALNLGVNVKMITEMAVKDESMEALKREAVELENIVIEEVFENLRCTRKGLLSENANGRLETFGQNKLGEKENSLWWVMDAMAVTAIALANEVTETTL